MTATISLEDQLGAMSVIDALRHQQRVVRDLVDLPQRRREVAARLQAYYAQKGIDVDQDTIDSGVRTYFAKRLEFTAPQTSRFQDAWARAYIKRGVWMKPLAIGTVSIALLVSGSVWIKSEWDARKLAAQQAQQQRAQKTFAQLLHSARAYQVEFEADTQAPARLVAAVRSRIDALIPKLERAQEHADAGSANALGEMGTLSMGFTLIKDRRAAIAAVRAALPLLARAENTEEPALRRRALDLRVQLEGIESTDQANLFVDEVQALVRSLDALPQLRAIALERDTARAAFENMKLSDASRQHVGQIVQDVTDAIAALDVSRATKAMVVLQKLLDYAKTPVKFQIVSRAGVKSGVERTAHDGGGKAWYLIVEATRPDGRPIEVPVESVETGGKKRTSLFGVRVSQAKFEQVKRDKLDDGHVNDRQMGEKPVNSLDMQFSTAVRNTDGSVNLITEW